MVWKVKSIFSNNNIGYFYITLFLFILFTSQKMYLGTKKSSFVSNFQYFNQESE